MREEREGMNHASADGVNRQLATTGAQHSTSQFKPSKCLGLGRPKRLWRPLERAFQETQTTTRFVKREKKTNIEKQNSEEGASRGATGISIRGLWDLHTTAVNGLWDLHTTAVKTSKPKSAHVRMSYAKHAFFGISIRGFRDLHTWEHKPV